MMQIVLGMIQERLALPDVANGFILDGFPRNLSQAAALEGLLKQLDQPLDVVVLMQVDNRRAGAPHRRPAHLPQLWPRVQCVHLATGAG